MNLIIAFLFIFFYTSSCQYLPQVAQDVEEIATDTAIKIEVSRETFQKETDLEINVSVQNKDAPTVKTTK
jgi:hypothetical protein